MDGGSKLVMIYGLRIVILILSREVGGDATKRTCGC